MMVRKFYHPSGFSFSWTGRGPGKRWGGSREIQRANVVSSLWSAGCIVASICLRFAEPPHPGPAAELLAVGFGTAPCLAWHSCQMWKVYEHMISVRLRKTCLETQEQPQWGTQIVKARVSTGEPNHAKTLTGMGLQSPCRRAAGVPCRAVLQQL